jgi:hypothetical protein
MPFDIPKGNVTDKLCKLAWQVVPRDVAVPASNTNELPDFVREAQGLHISARSVAQFRHRPN